jgi:hypothetical protein
LFCALKKPLFRQWDFYVALFTALLAIFTAVLAFGTLWLAWLTKKLVTETQKARSNGEATTERVLRDAERSAIAAELSAEAAKRLVEVGQAPCIAIESTTATSEGDELVLTLVLKNYGQTPGRKVVSACGFLECDECNMNFPEPPPKPQYSERIQPVPPGGFATIRYLVPKQFRDACNDRDFFVYGKVTYQDFFSSLHTTEWSSRTARGQDGDLRFILTGQYEDIRVELV